MSNCECELCTKGRRLRQIASGLSDADSQWLRDFGIEFLHVSTDEQYYRNIVEGSWPDSVAILERALARAKDRVLKEKHGIVEPEKPY